MSDLFDIEELEKTNNRIKELEVLIQKHQKAYYNGEAEISDFEFDKRNHFSISAGCNF